MPMGNIKKLEIIKERTHSDVIIEANENTMCCNMKLIQDIICFYTVYSIALLLCFKKQLN